MEKVSDNKYEKACKEFLKGCTCATLDKQEECPECLRAFCDCIRKLARDEGYEGINEYCLGSENICGFPITSIETAKRLGWEYWNRRWKR